MKYLTTLFVISLAPILASAAKLQQAPPPGQAPRPPQAPVCGDPGCDCGCLVTGECNCKRAPYKGKMLKDGTRDGEWTWSVKEDGTGWWWRYDRVVTPVFYPPPAPVFHAPVFRPAPVFFGGFGGGGGRGGC